MNWFVLFAILSLGLNASALKVLFLGPFMGKSHFLYCQSFVLELVKRGHDVTFMTSHSLKHMNLANYTEVLVDPPQVFDDVVSQKKLMEGGGGPFSQLLMYASFPLMAAEHALSTANVKDFINSNNHHFDIVINEEFFHDVFLMFGHKFQAPTVTICPYGYSDFFERQHGLLTPWSHVPHMFLTYTDKMSFTERWYNTALSLADWILRSWVVIPNHQSLAQKHFGHLGAVPTIQELNSNVSITFVNNHRSLAPPRPTLPSIIEIGGSHVNPPKPLPADIKQFLDVAKDGAIFMSFGTIMKGSGMPKEKIAAFLNTFKNIKQRFIWKYEDDTLTDVPSNVLIKNWLPQSDILAHPNVRLFISHGGLFSTLESLDRGVPLLIVPFFLDQHRNAKRVENSGYGRSILFPDITETTFLAIVKETLEPQYYNRAKELQALWKDNMNSPMDEFEWWIQHVVKYKGAKHLKSHAADMSLFTYLLIDVFAVTIFGFIVVLYLLKVVLKKLFCRTQKSGKAKKE